MNTPIRARPVWLLSILVTPSLAQIASEAGTDDGSAAESAVTANAEPISWIETRIEIGELADAGELDAAIRLAERLVTFAESEFGRGSTELADSYLLVGSLQNAAEEFELAEFSILRSIEQYELAGGPASPTMIDPFLALGDNYYEAREYISAINAYDEARTIGRRNFGLLNQDQLEILDRMATSAERLGNFDEARDLRYEAMTVVHRFHGDAAIETIEARFRYADWLVAHFEFDDAYYQYLDIRKLIDDHFDDDPLMQVRALREMAYSFRARRFPDGRGIGALNEALKLVRDMPEPDALTEALVLRDIGDWYLTFDQTWESDDRYIESWNLLSATVGGSLFKREWFEASEQIYSSPIPAFLISNEPDAPWGHAVAEFTIDPTGIARDIVVIESDPEGLMDGVLYRHIASSRFRPRVSDGALVEARTSFALEFQYQPRFAPQ